MRSARKSGDAHIPVGTYTPTLLDALEEFDTELRLTAILVQQCGYREDTSRMRKAATKKPTPTYNEAGPKVPKKSRMKETKEARAVFETIASKLLHESSLNAHQKLENFCMDLINRRLADVRQDVVMIESSLSARIGQLEYKFNDLNSKMTDLSTNIVHQNTLLREELSTFTQQFTTGIENERNKRLNAMKRMQTIAEGSGTNAGAMAAVSTLGDDLRVQSRELSRLKENVDGMLMKRYGFVPGSGGVAEGLASSFNQGLDAGVVLDNISSRLQNLEGLMADEDIQPSFHGSHGGLMGARSPLSGSPLRGGSAVGGSISKKFRSTAIRQLEDSVFELRGQMQQQETEMQQVKSVVLSRGGNHLNQSYEEGPRGGGRGETAAEVKLLQKKLKKLTQNTTRACQSLSTGLTDVQQATLNLYTWSDGAHECFGRISHELGLPGNISSRARVYRPPKDADIESYIFNDV